MRKLLSTITLTAFTLFFSNLASAQTIIVSADLEKFYTEFFNNRQSRDALVKGYCTDSLYQAWKVSSSDEPFVFGSCDNYSGVQIRQLPKDNQYLVLFGIWFLGENDFRSHEGVSVSIENGKINKVNHQAPLSTSDLNGTKWRLVIRRLDKPNDYYKISKYYYEFTNDEIIWQRVDLKGAPSVPNRYYLTDTIPTQFDSTKVGTNTKGQYYVRTWGGDLICNPIIYFNKEEGLMILGSNIYIMKEKEIRKNSSSQGIFP